MNKKIIIKRRLRSDHFLKNIAKKIGGKVVEKVAEKTVNNSGIAPEKKNEAVALLTKGAAPAIKNFSKHTDIIGKAALATGAVTGAVLAAPAIASALGSNSNAAVKAAEIAKPVTTVSEVSKPITDVVKPVIDIAKPVQKVAEIVPTVVKTGEKIEGVIDSGKKILALNKKQSADNMKQSGIQIGRNVLTGKEPIERPNLTAETKNTAFEFNMTSIIVISISVILLIIAAVKK